MANESSPQDLYELLEKVKTAAESFGFYEKKDSDDRNGRFRDCIIDNKTKKIKELKGSYSNFWFGYIRHDQNPSGKYEGLSYVIFPESSGDRCLVAIGIGSNSIGKDQDLVSNPGFRRSFMRLNNKEKSGAKFFFKIRFDEMETSTPGLQEEIYSTEGAYEEVLKRITTKYNADDDSDYPGMLPAAFIVNYKTEDGWDLIKAWLAQYAMWRNWDKFQKGTINNTHLKDIEAAISKCRQDAKCPTPDDIYNGYPKS